MKVILVEFDNIYLDLSWKWLNDPEIKYLTDTPDFSRKDQLRWFDSLKEKEDYLIWGVELDKIPIGVCGLKNITANDCEKWMYIGNKEYWGQGIGKKLITLLEDKARELGKTSLWGKIRNENHRSISNNEKLAYRVEAKTVEYVIMRKQL